MFTSFLKILYKFFNRFHVALFNKFHNISRIIRNRRYIIRIQLGSDERELLDSKKKLMFNNEYEIIDPEKTVKKIAKSPLDLQNIQKKNLKIMRKV